MAEVIDSNARLKADIELRLQRLESSVKAYRGADKRDIPDEDRMKARVRLAALEAAMNNVHRNHDD